MMIEKKFNVDESLYSIGWRFNSPDCQLIASEIEKIIFLTKSESEKLWGSLYPFKKLMEIKKDDYMLLEKKELDFDNDNSRNFFIEKMIDSSYVFFFWGRSNSAIVPVNLFIKAWDDFFYPSDENCILYLINNNRIIYSYEETFFYSQIL